MSEFLLIAPSEWVKVDADQMTGLIGYSIGMFADIQGRGMTDLNTVLRPSGWLPEGQRVLDVSVINNELFFKFEADLD